MVNPNSEHKVVFPTDWKISIKLMIYEHFSTSLGSSLMFYTLDLWHRFSVDLEY